MAVQFLNYEDENKNSLNLDKLKKNQRNSCLKSIWPILISIVFYISIFYLFDLQPASVVSTPKFWFVISNTIVLIIAADLTAFLKTTEHDRFYDEYVKINSARTKGSVSAMPTSEMEHVKINDNKIPAVRAIDHEEPLQEKVIDMDHGRINESNQQALQIYKPQSSTTSSLKIDRRVESIDEMITKRKKEEGVKCARSNSDKAILMAAVAENEGRTTVLQRTLSERHEAPLPTVEENDFSSITNEELNRRVEEFIQRFNRQIRLQAAASTRQNSSELGSA